MVGAFGRSLSTTTGVGRKMADASLLDEFIMTAQIIKFPRAFAVIKIMREGGAWLVLIGDHGWLHGDAESARRDARWLSRNLALPIREAS